MRRTPSVLVLLAFLLAPAALASNCPPNALHCQLLVTVGQSAYVTAEFGVAADTELATSGAIFAFAPGARVHVWAKVALAANTTATNATVSVALEETAGVSLPGKRAADIDATTTPQNHTFPLTLDADLAPGDIVFVPVSVTHEDGSRAATHLPVQALDGGGATGTGSTGRFGPWWLYALFLLGGVVVGHFLTRAR